MGKVVVSQFITVDGVVEDPGGSESHERGGWAFKYDRGPDGDQFKLDEVMASEALLLGRMTYEGFADAWPSREGEFADKFNDMPKYVVSTTLDEPRLEQLDADQGRRGGRGGEAPRAGRRRHPRQRQRPARADAARARPRRRARLMVFPVVLGGGKRLFDETAEPASLELVESRPAGETLILIYAPAGGQSASAGQASPARSRA